MAETVISSHELHKLMELSSKLARRSGRDLTTLHVVLAALEFHHSMIGAVLSNFQIKLKGDNGLRKALEKLKASDKVERLSEPADTLKLIMRRACDMAGSRDNHVNSLFYFITMIRVRRALGTRALEACGVDLSRLRQALLGRISNLAPLRGNGEAPEDDGELEVLPELLPPEQDIIVTRPPEVNGNAGAVEIGAQNSAAEAVASATLPEAKETARPLNDEEARYALDPEEFPELAKSTTNITLRAVRGEIDPVIGRDREITQLINILKKRQINNPCLVGDPGVGKTALVEGLAREMAGSSKRTSRLHDRIILELETAALVAGTQLRGSFSERMLALRDEVRKLKDRVIIFVDEIHTLIGAGGGDSSPDAANELKTALARGEFPTIGATTTEEYRLRFEKDKAFNRRFEVVILAEPSQEEAIEIIQGIIDLYEEHHGVIYEARAIETAVRFTSRYVPHRRLPAKAIDVLDQAGASLSGLHERVGEEAIARTVAEQVNIPVERMLLNSVDRFKDMGEFLGKEVVGHQEVLHRICDAVKRGFAGFSSNRPLASFLFAGPPGVGKLQTAKALSRFLFDRDDAILMFQGSEFTEKHSIAKLIGAGPGYVGHERGGRLTEGMFNRPFRLILFRDLMVAHPDIQELVAEMLNTGELTDGQNRKVHFSNAVVAICQDLSMDKYFGNGNLKRVGFAPSDDENGAENSSADVLRRVVKEFPASLLQAVDDRLVFFPLDNDEVRSVARLEVASSSNRLSEERDIRFELSDEALDHLIMGGGFTRNRGGRLLQQTLRRTVESFLAERIHAGDIRPGQNVVVDFSDGELSYDLT
jgi:ATP-dependent Clp protease ATP-binding subunit ClpC